MRCGSGTARVPAPPSRRRPACAHARETGRCRSAQELAADVEDGEAAEEPDDEPDDEPADDEESADDDEDEDEEDDELPAGSTLFEAARESVR